MQKTLVFFLMLCYNLQKESNISNNGFLIKQRFFFLNSLACEQFFIGKLARELKKAATPALNHYRLLIWYFDFSLLNIEKTILI